VGNIKSFGTSEVGKNLCNHSTMPRIMENQKWAKAAQTV
jgi:hypothetical protein